LDETEINFRLDVVEVFKDNTVARNALIEGPLHGVPDLDTVVAR